MCGILPYTFSEKLLKKPSNIRFLGNVRNIVEYLQISDCFISASLAEGLPNTVLEAMACGLPTILSNIPPHKELCSDSACFFEVHNVVELSKMINCFKDCDNSPKELVGKQFSAQLMSEKYQKLYKEEM